MAGSSRGEGGGGRLLGHAGAMSIHPGSRNLSEVSLSMTSQEECQSGSTSAEGSPAIPMFALCLESQGYQFDPTFLYLLSCSSA